MTASGTVFTNARPPKMGLTASGPVSLFPNCQSKISSAPEIFEAISQLRYMHGGEDDVRRECSQFGRGRELEGKSIRPDPEQVWLRRSLMIISKCP